MTAPIIHGKPRPVTASHMVDALAADLLRIKSEDGLRWTDIGDVLRRSEDQAAKYADGSATMDCVSFLRAENAWGGRFTGSVRRLLGSPGASGDAHAAQSAILRATLALSVALEDGDLSLDEIRGCRGTLENARDAIDAQLGRLTPQGVRA